MPKCAGCMTPICACSLEAGDNVTITGDGSELLPYHISAAAGGGGGTHLTIVAAADSTPEHQALAQFVCTGTADEVVINAACIAAGYGGTVLLLEGDYYTTSAIVTYYGQYFLGSGYQACTIYFDGNNDAVPYVDTGPSGNNYGIVMNCIYMADFLLNVSNGSGTGYRGGIKMIGDRPTIERVEISLDSDATVQPKQNGAIFMATTHCLARDCHIEAWDGTGIDLSADQDYCTITHNFIGAGLAINGDGTEKITIVDNNIQGAASTVATPFDYLHLYGGILEFVCGSGIVIWANGGDGTIVSGNRIEGCNKHGIVADGAELVTITNNFVIECSQEAGNTYDGIAIRNGCYSINVQGNKVVGSHRYGINVADPVTLPVGQNDPSYNTLVANNDLLEGGDTAAFNDSGIDTVTLGGNRIA